MKSIVHENKTDGSTYVLEPRNTTDKQVKHSQRFWGANLERVSCSKIDPPVEGPTPEQNMECSLLVARAMLAVLLLQCNDAQTSVVRCTEKGFLVE